MLILRKRVGNSTFPVLQVQKQRVLIVKTTGAAGASQGENEREKEEGREKPIEKSEVLQERSQEIPTPGISREENVSSYADRLSKFLQGWKNITNDQAVLDWVTGIKIYLLLKSQYSVLSYMNIYQLNFYLNIKKSFRSC